MRRIDLNAARAARAEAQSEPMLADLGDETFTLVPELPIDFITQLSEGKFREAVRMLFPSGVEHEAAFERFMALGLSVPDLMELAGAYTGMTVGESPASPRSSKNRGTRSRPTSKATTG